MPMTSDYDQVMARIEKAIDGFGFDVRTEGKGTLGDELVEITAQGIIGRSHAGHGPNQEQWPANEPKYAAFKEAHYGESIVNSRTGQMLSHRSLTQNSLVHKEDVEIPYGTGTPPGGDDVTNPMGYVSPSDLKSTDIEKAFFAHSQGRDFFALDDTIEGKILDRTGEALGQHLEKTLG